MDAILGRGEGETVSSPNSGIIFWLKGIIELKEKQHEEIFILAKGVPSEVEKIRVFSVLEYLMLLKYTVDSNKKD